MEKAGRNRFGLVWFGWLEVSPSKKKKECDICSWDAVLLLYSRVYRYRSTVRDDVCVCTLAVLVWSEGLRRRML